MVDSCVARDDSDVAPSRVSWLWTQINLSRLRRRRTKWVWSFFDDKRSPLGSRIICVFFFFFLNHTLAHCLWEGTRWRPWQLQPKELRKVRFRDPFVFVFTRAPTWRLQGSQFCFFREADVFFVCPYRSTKRKQRWKYNNGLLRYYCWRVLQVPLEYSWFVPNAESYKLFFSKSARLLSWHTVQISLYFVYVYTCTTCLFCT